MNATVLLTVGIGVLFIAAMALAALASSLLWTYSRIGNLSRINVDIERLKSAHNQLDEQFHGYVRRRAVTEARDKKAQQSAPSAAPRSDDDAILDQIERAHGLRG